MYDQWIANVPSRACARLAKEFCVADHWNPVLHCIFFIVTFLKSSSQLSSFQNRRAPKKVLLSVVMGNQLAHESGPGRPARTFGRTGALGLSKADLDKRCKPSG